MVSQKHTISLKKYFFFVPAIVLIFIIGCKQDEGIGGNSHLKGVLVEQFYNDDFSMLLSEQPAMDEDVYILFGDENTVGENTSTSNTGNFSFNYLWPGNYTLYYYVQNPENPELGDIEESVDIDLVAGEELDLGTLYMKRSLNWDEGTSSISGKVMLTNYKNESEWPNLEIKDRTPAQEQEIYLTYGEHTFYDSRIRTQEDGTFVFSNLIKGNYKIVVYSEDVKGGTAKIAITELATISEEKQNIDLGTIEIEKH
jgi:hypothetical protein